VQSLSKSNFLLQILSHALALKFSSGLLVHIVTTNKNRAKESKLQALQLLSTTPYFIVGQVRVFVIVVVINAPFPSLSLKHRAKEIKLQPPTTRMVVVCKHTLTQHCPTEELRWVGPGICQVGFLENSIELLY
jgi:hypothetical protein